MIKILLHRICLRVLPPLPAQAQVTVIQVTVQQSNRMDQLMKQMWDNLKGKGKGKDKNSNKRRKVVRKSPWERLLLATSKLALNQDKQQRQQRADLVHSAYVANPPPEEFEEAISTTMATKNTERRTAAKATWLSLISGVVGTKKTLPDPAKAALQVLQKHHKAPKNLDNRVLECKVSVFYDLSQCLISWWTRNLEAEDEALQDVLVGLGAEIRHGPALPFGLARETQEALNAVQSMQGEGSTTASSWQY